jgi:endonuclease/exonuclease/phosphatase family metal-dependent hydrolase
MHKILRVVTFLAVTWLLPILDLLFAAETESKPAEPLTVMTFNLKYASPKPPHAWPQRRPVMRECIEKIAPDLFGIQEGLYGQLKDLAQDLPRYAWIGLGRDGGSRGEFMAIFYLTNRFEPLEYDHFWLSDTPEVMGSTTWGNSNRRMVTWVKFSDRQNQQQFYFFNTHLDHQIQTAREKGATLIRQRIEKLHTNLPVILAGDFNAAAGANKAYDILVQDQFLTDLWNSAGERRNEGYNSFHGYNPPRKEGIRIDWILATQGVKAVWMEIVTYQRDGESPSDHFPVVARIQLVP